MKLCEHPDFKDAISAAKDHFNHPGLTEQLIEKDYYVTEALRIVATQWSTQVIFKGGTSLSKGWKLIERFSEDIDLFLNRDAFDPVLGENKTDNVLKAIEKVVGQHPGLSLLKEEGRSKRGIYRHSYFDYSQLFPGIGAIANRVFLETGTRSGTHPIQTVELSSYVAQFLKDIGDSFGAEDESSFFMELLHFRRTFVEKLFTIHSKVIKSQYDGRAIGADARHYYDLFCLAQQSEVQQMLEGEEYIQLKQDCDRMSRKHFEKDYAPPKNLTFSNSEALFPNKELRQAISQEYNQQCRNLCYGDYPTWEELEACFEKIRAQL